MISGRFNWRVALVSAAAIAATGALVVSWTTRPTVSSIERQIKSHLPLGSSKLDVTEFLDARHIEYSGLSVGGRYEAHYTRDGSRVEKVFLTAVIHNSYGPFPAEERILIIFYFDNNERLIDYEIRAHQIAE